MLPRILLIESSASARAALHEMLTESGYNVVSPASGAAAFEAAAQRGPFHLLIVETSPRGSHVELARAFHTLYPAAAIVLMAALPDATLELNEVRIDKPIRFTALANLVGDALEQTAP